MLAQLGSLIAQSQYFSGSERKSGVSPMYFLCSFPSYFEWQIQCWSVLLMSLVTTFHPPRPNHHWNLKLGTMELNTTVTWLPTSTCLDPKSTFANIFGCLKTREIGAGGRRNWLYGYFARLYPVSCNAVLSCLYTEPTCLVTCSRNALCMASGHWAVFTTETSTL